MADPSMIPAAIHKGLDNVYVEESSICFIDGEASKLYYRGYAIDELAEHSSFEEVACLLIRGRLPKENELEDFQGRLRSSRALGDRFIGLLRALPKAHPLDGLRTAVSALGAFDPNPLGSGHEENLDKCLGILAKAPTIIASLERLRQGGDILKPKDGLGHAANFLHMLSGREPDHYEARVMDTILILHAEHEMNASTFSSTVTASTLADMYSVMVAAIGTLRGPLHGGANEEALKMILQVGEPSRAEAFVEDALARKRKIMGFGHRLYKSYDPRYLILKGIGGKLAAMKGQSKLFETAEAIEGAAMSKLAHRHVFPNVDFYSGIVLHLLGIPTDLFTSVFCMSRIAGWSAHVLEYLESNRLIRPRAYYVGELNLQYIPVERR